MTIWAGVEPFVHRLGWTLIQFLWQGTVIAVLFAATRVLIGRRLSSRSRYAMACGALVLMAAAPFLTYVFSGRPSARPVAWLVPLGSGWTQAVPWVVALWLAGVCICSVRLAGGWMVTRRLRHVGTQPASDEWRQVFDDLSRRLRLSRPVAFFVSTIVDVPTVVGWLEPIVLMPVEAMAGLPPQYVSTLLAHELAHVRRHDYIVNVLQRVVETVLFYHPAIWWVSEQIRVEREMCCDDIVVAVEGDPLVYARALTELESLRQPHVALLAANGPSLLHRIRRLLGHTLSAWQLLPGPAAIVAIAVVCGIGVVALRARDGDDTVPSRSQTMEVPVSAPAPSLLTAALLGPVGPAASPQAPSAPTQSPRPGMPASSSAARPDPSGTAVVRGRITRADDGTPVRRARLTMYPVLDLRRIPLPLPPSYTGQTDDAGQYQIDGITPGRYDVSVERSGYVGMSYGQTNARGPSTPLEVKPGDVRGGLDFALQRGGAVSGTVFDETGEAVAGARVLLGRVIYRDWERVLSAVGPSSATTDDAGHFRVFGVAPGNYYVMVTPMSAIMPSRPAFGYAPTFYPGTLVAVSAGLVTVGAGQQVNGIDFPLVPSPTGEISGRFVMPDGSAASDATGTLMRVQNPDALVPLSPNLTLSNVSRDARFTYVGLAPGRYRVTAMSIAGRGRAQAEFVVDGTRLSDLVVVLSPGTPVSGRVRSDTGTGTLDPAKVQISIVSPDPSSTSAEAAPRIGADGAFAWSGVFTPRLLFRATAPGWALQKVLLNGVDITDTPLDLPAKPIEGLEILLTDRLSQLNGTVVDAKGTPASGVTVVAFADDETKWGRGTRFAGNARTDAQGQFAIPGLPPATYQVVAVSTFESGSDTNPEKLQEWRAFATRVALTDTASRNLNLKAVD